MAILTTNPSTETSGPVPVPRLQNGDHLTRVEFERRYDAEPGLKKAELIEGVVHMPSPVRQGKHSKPHFNVIAWLGPYVVATPGVEGGDNGSVRLDLENMPQPDVFLFLQPHHGGQAVVDEDDYVAGAPELIVEIAASSVSYDLHEKSSVYLRHGVREYIVWRVEDQVIDWLVRRQGRFEPLVLTDGLYRSEVFPGLWLDSQALVTGNLAQVTKIAQAGIASPEHQAFVEKLQSKV